MVNRSLYDGSISFSNKWVYQATELDIKTYCCTLYFHVHQKSLRRGIDWVVSTIQQTLQSILGQPTMTVLEPVGDLNWNKQLGHTAKLRAIGRVCARSTDSTVHG